MSTGLRRYPLSRPTRAGSGCAWLARWLLVLVLVVDLVGAPLHAHAHDSGVDGHAWAPHVDAPGWDTPHVEDADDALSEVPHEGMTFRGHVGRQDVEVSGLIASHRPSRGGG